MANPKQQYINTKMGIKDVVKEVPAAAKKVGKGIVAAGNELGKVAAQAAGVNMDWKQEREKVKSFLSKKK